MRQIRVGKRLQARLDGGVDYFRNVIIDFIAPAAEVPRTRVLRDQQRLSPTEAEKALGVDLEVFVFAAAHKKTSDGKFGPFVALSHGPILGAPGTQPRLFQVWPLFRPQVRVRMHCPTALFHPGSSSSLGTLST